MARGLFSSANNFSTSSVITSYPFTFACWFRTSDVNTGETMVNMTELASGDWFDLALAAGGAVRANATDFGTGSGVADTSSVAANNSWHHACGVFQAANSRSAYIDGSSKVTSAVNVNANIGGVDEIQVGWFRSVIGSSLHHIAEVGIWSVALSDEEVASLAEGYSCNLIRSQNLIHHMPLIRNSQDLRGDLVENGTVGVTNHPPIIGVLAA